MNLTEVALAAQNAKQELYRIATLSRILDTPEQTIRNWIHGGRLPACKIGGCLYVRAIDVDNLVRDAIPVRRAQ